jgi:hypothetical protein
MSESKFRFRNRIRNRNSDVEIETKIEIQISTSKPTSKFRFRHRNFDEIMLDFCRNFDFVISKQSKSKFRFRRNFDFVESKKNFRGNPKSTPGGFRERYTRFALIHAETKCVDLPKWTLRLPYFDYSYSIGVVVKDRKLVFSKRKYIHISGRVLIVKDNYGNMHDHSRIFEFILNQRLWRTAFF